MPEYTLKARFLNAVWHFVISSNKKLRFDVMCGYNGCEADPIYFTGLTWYMNSSLKQEDHLLFTYAYLLRK